MLKITKKIRRELSIKSTIGKYRGNPIIMELLPSENIQFKIKGTRETATISLLTCYMVAVNNTINAKYAESMREYKQKLAQGKRAKKPSKPNMFLYLPKLF